MTVINKYSIIWELRNADVKIILNQLDDDWEVVEMANGDEVDSQVFGTPTEALHCMSDIIDNHTMEQFNYLINN